MRRFSRHEIRVFAVSFCWCLPVVVGGLLVGGIGPAAFAAVVAAVFAAIPASMEQAARDCEAFHLRIKRRRRYVAAD